MKSKIVFVIAAVGFTSGCAGHGIPEEIGIVDTPSGSNTPAIPATYVSTSSNNIASSSSNTVVAPFQAGDTTATYYVPSATTQIAGSGSLAQGAIQAISASNTVTIATDAADNIDSVKFNISTGNISFTPTFDGSAITTNSPFIQGTNGATPGPNGVSFLADAYSYSGFGIWASDPSTPVQYTGAFAFGIATQPSAVPTTGTATYNGVTGGAGTNGPNSAFSFGGNAQVVANFATQSVSTTFSSITEFNLATGAQTSFPTITGSASISGNQYTGPITGGGLTGSLHGAFYGPSAQETAGVWQGINGTSVLIGGFAAK